MKGSRTVRLLVWGVGVVACLGYYAAKASQWPRVTSVGRETPLFPRWNLETNLLERPGGGRTLFTVAEVQTGAPPPGPPSVQREPWGWPNPRSISQRRITVLPEGTWEMDGGAIRRVWRFSATQWKGKDYLRGNLMSGQTPFILDLKTSRIRFLQDGDPDFYDPYAPEDDYYREDSDLLAVLNSPLEGGDKGLDFTKQKGYRVGEKDLYLLWAPWRKGRRHPIYAGSDDAAPRLLRLVDGGVPLQLSRDGRTLYFSRGNEVWRLDLKKPLPELLDEVPLPELPKPSLE